MISTIAPWIFLGQIAAKEKQYLSKTKRLFTYAQFAVPFYLWTLCLFLRIKYKYIDNIGWAIFIGFVVLASRLRTRLRRKHIIVGNIIEDAALVAIFPITVVQMHEQVSNVIFFVTQGTHV